VDLISFMAGNQFGVFVVRLIVLITLLDWLKKLSRKFESIP